MDDIVVFLDKIYEEAMDLAAEARNYVALGQKKNSHDHLPPRLRVVASYEIMRLTTRLTQSIAWLLLRRAVESSEIASRQFIEADEILTARDICLGTAGQDNMEMPEELRSLLERSHRLYERILHMDEVMKNRPAGGPGGELEHAQGS